MAFIRDINVDSSLIESIPLVQEIMDVFPSNLLRVPSSQGIDFAIDVELRTKPISIPPYCMSLVELKELKDKLKDLLSKEFIRTSMSS